MIALTMTSCPWLWDVVRKYNGSLGRGTGALDVGDPSLTSRTQCVCYSESERREEAKKRLEKREEHNANVGFDTDGNR